MFCLESACEKGCNEWVAGYYARHIIIKSIIRNFIDLNRSLNQKMQIVVLGCGFDTLCFQLHDEGVLGPDILYVECDFDDVVSAKQNIIHSHEELRSSLMSEMVSCSNKQSATRDAGKGCSTATKNPHHGICYRLFGADIRDVKQLQRRLSDISDFDASKPTFFLAECVLVYMEHQFSQNLLQWLASEHQEAVFLVYEQINPYDAFGKQMMINLTARGCPLKGILGSLQDQKERLLRCGWNHAECHDLLAMFNQLIPPSEVRRINLLEMLDEQEEWNLLLQHYCIALGVNTKFHNMLYDFTTIHPPQR